MDAQSFATVFKPTCGGCLTWLTDSQTGRTHDTCFLSPAGLGSPSSDWWLAIARATMAPGESAGCTSGATGDELRGLSANLRLSQEQQP